MDRKELSGNTIALPPQMLEVSNALNALIQERGQSTLANKVLKSNVPLVADAMLADAAPFAAEAAAAPTSLMGYHMVTAISQNTINFQFKKLWQAGIIHRKLQIANEELGLALNAELDAPTVQLGMASENHTVLFSLRLKSGTLKYYQGFGPKAVEKQLPFKNWRYTFKVNMDMIQHERNAQSTGVVPPEVQRKLDADKITDDLFTIRRLFMDFQSANLADYEPALSQMPLEDGGEAGSGVVLQFSEVLKVFFKALEGRENPYILGYSIEKKRPEGPRSLFAPTRANYTTFQDPSQPGLSALNFLLMTRGEPFPADPRAGVFPSNWVASNEYDGRMVVGSEQFRSQYVESVVLPEIHTAVQSASECGLGDWKSVEVPPNVVEAMLGGISRAWGASASWDNLQEDDGFGNRGFGVVLDKSAPAGSRVYLEERRSTDCAVWMSRGPEITLQGTGTVKKRLEFYHYPLNIKAYVGHAQTQVDFGFTIKLAAGTNGKLSVEVTFAESKPKQEQDTGALFKIADFFVGLVTTNLSQSLERMNKSRSDVQLRMVGTMQNFLRETLGEVETRVILPAGDVFFFKNASFDSAQNLLLDISYKTER